MKKNTLVQILSGFLFATIPLFGASNPALAAVKTGGFDTGDEALYEIDLPAGRYVINVSTENGDVDMALGNLDFEPIVRGRNEGNESVQVELQGGTYTFALVMHRCNSWSSGCEILIEVLKEGREISPTFRIVGTSFAEDTAESDEVQCLDINGFPTTGYCYSYGRPGYRGY